MRKSYLDNLRWVTVVLVVLYYDLYQYIVYPWFMLLLFIVSGASARYALEKHTGKEFIKSRTTKLLVPVTVGLIAFQFIQGWINISFSGVTDNPDMPLVGKVIACILSGIGVLWYLQMLWIFSLVIVLIKKIDKCMQEDSFLGIDPYCGTYLRCRTDSQYARYRHLQIRTLFPRIPFGILRILTR